MGRGSGRRKEYVRTGGSPSKATLRVRKHREKMKQLACSSKDGPTALQSDQSDFSTLTSNDCFQAPHECMDVGASTSIHCSSLPTSSRVSEECTNVGTSSPCDVVKESQESALADEITEGCLPAAPLDPVIPASDNEEEIPKECLLPLCSHTDCTADDVMLMCLAIGHRHNLTWAAIEDMMKMFNAVYGTKKINTTKVSLLKRFFEEKEESNICYHYYCEKYVGEVDSDKRDVFCDICNSVLSDPKSATYFATLSLEKQLKQLLESNKEVADAILTYRFQREKSVEGNLEDIYDRSEYQMHSVAGGILSLPQNFSYSFFTDGVASGKSKKSFWPIYVSINELPPKVRRRHMLLVGLYHGKSQPNQRMFLKPFVDEANKLSDKGFEWNCMGQVTVSRVLPIAGILDSGARYKVLNMQSFSAFYGCTFCYHVQTRTLKKLKFTINSGREVEMRTKASHQSDVSNAYSKRHEAQEKNRHCRGVKGPSTVSMLTKFDVTRGFPVDYMHNILLGVTKTYFELLFEPLRRKCWVILDDEDSFAMEDVMEAIDARLLQILPPSCISRCPRTIKDWGSWKANEWRNWLLFYALPCLKGLLKDKYLDHFKLLSVGTSVLLQGSVSKEDARYVHRLYQLFVINYERYFGEEFMYYNIHLLLHVVQGVMRFGPLFTHNAFMYESRNRHLLQLHKNPFNAVKEICKKYSTFQALPRLLAKFATSDRTIEFCENVLDHRLVNLVNCDSCLMLGAGKLDYALSEEEHAFLARTEESVICNYFDRMLYKGMRVATSQYCNVKKNNDSIVHNNCGEIFEVKALYAIIDKRVRILARQMTSEPLRELRITTCFSKLGDLKLLRPDDILGLCVAVNIDSKTYLNTIPFGCYDD
ncbi:Ribosome hibernation promoting factor [Frankliniella fusca]|uniref:Ribosome hibernation promoting factor n=1 Tax=Frankliniella fusca TaxID=407009 RepID=A0AAE1I3Z9_9NEOP|nr:Ribosome hibernation promoting factor [Frankliniella fusca]